MNENITVEPKILDSIKSIDSVNYLIYDGNLEKTNKIIQLY